MADFLIEADCVSKRNSCTIAGRLIKVELLPGISTFAVFATLMGFMLSSCATVGSLRPGSGSTFEVENRTYEQVWKAAVTAVTRSLTIVESNKNTGIIKAEKGAGVTTWGEVVGVFVHPADVNSRRFTVEVVSNKRSQLQITGQNWERTIIEGMKAELEL